MINIHRIIPNTTVEGPGNRTAIWFQGCAKRCKGCFVPETWSNSHSILYDESALAQAINQTKDIEGVTILGGEPFDQKEGLHALISGLKKSLSVIVFTGYQFAELEGSNPHVEEILQRIDVLVDGEYIEELRDLSRPMVGSSNQQFHFLTNRYTMKDFPDNKIEVRLDKSGRILINGNGDIEKITDSLVRRDDEIS